MESSYTSHHWTVPYLVIPTAIYDTYNKCISAKCKVQIRVPTLTFKPRGDITKNLNKKITL